MRIESDPDPWTPDALRERIAQGQRLLAEFRHEPVWMTEVVEREIHRKRRRLEALQGEPAAP